MFSIATPGILERGFIIRDAAIVFDLRGKKTLFRCRRQETAAILPWRHVNHSLGCGLVLTVESWFLLQRIRDALVGYLRL